MGGEALRGREHAQRLARRGYYVHPVRDDKRPYFDNWQNRATGDADEVSDLWSKHPDALVAVVPGKSRTTVVDLDVKDDANGIETLAALGLWDSEHPVVGTSLSGNGRHLWFRGVGGSSQDVVPVGTDAERPTGIDLRGETGYVVVPYDLPKVKKVSTPLPGWATLPRLSERGETATVSADEVSAWLEACPAGAQAPEVRTAVEKFRTGQVGHGDVFPAVVNLVGLAADGHEGVREAIEEARALYLAGQWNTDKYRKEFASSLANAIAIKGAPGSADLDWFDADDAEEFEGMTAEERLEALTETPEDRERAERERRVAEERERRAIRREADRLDAEEARGGRVSMADRVVRLSDLAARPKPPALVEGVLGQGQTAMIVADSNVGKTFAAISLAHAVATGTRWHGREVRQGRVLYVVGEDEAGFPERMKAIQVARGAIEEDDLDSILEPFNLDDETAVADLVSLVQARGYALIVLDPLARFIVGMDENKQDQMGVAMSALDTIRRATPGATILVPHHTKKDGGYRGSSAIFAAMDTALDLSRKDGALELRLDKSKWSALSTIGAFRLAPVSGTDSVIFDGISRADAARAFEPDESAWDNLLQLIEREYGTETAAPRTELKTAAVRAGIPEGSFGYMLTACQKRGYVEFIGGATKRSVLLTGAGVARNNHVRESSSMELPIKKTKKKDKDKKS